MKSKIQNPKSKILIAGAGVSGASAAIRLANDGFHVCLIEREKFPRHKLCGEFISPESFAHFRELGVFDEMMSAGGDSILQTVFYSLDGKKVSVPSAWFGTGNSPALSLSRAMMDFILLERAKNVGVEVFEETSVTNLLLDNGKIRGVKTRAKNGENLEIEADILIDATGRARTLGKLAEKTVQSSKSRNQSPKSKLVGFKAHLKNARIERDVCEIYFFRGGYGGLSPIENGAANHCFLIDARIVREFGGNADKIVREIVFKNKRAAETMEKAELIFDWLAVAVDGFGRKSLQPAPNLIAIGDAAAFIDPFTGSGMLMALESGKLAARAIGEDFAGAAEIYQKLHHENFNRRLRICSLLRRAAFFPNLAGAAISVLNLSSAARQILARATRSEVKAQS